MQLCVLTLEFCNDRDECKKYAKDWTPVNLDDYIAKFDIKSDDYNMQINLRKMWIEEAVNSSV